MLSKIGMTCATLVFAVAAWATPVTSNEAARAVQTWIGLRAQLGCQLGASTAGVRTRTATNGVPFHVVKLAGGGFVVTSADTESEPIVAFSPSEDLVESDENPLWVMLRRDFAATSTGVARLTHAVAASASSSSASASTASTSSSAQKWARLLPIKVRMASCA